MGVVIFVVLAVIIVSTRGGKSLVFAWFLIAAAVSLLALLTGILFGFSACPRWFCLF